ncbi:SUMF1/EgtB/PvdO family nonheme iron enzyme [Opitutales bacterium]|nr:SUMF1/EgtB/PvdO family nonheme iron enzyme [Opitutales bacterium]
MKSLVIFPLFFLSFFTLWSSPPVPYTGKLAINTVNYHGNANFTFSLHDGNGTTHWRNGADANSSIQVFVRNGRYSILLGGQGMNVLPSSLFLTEDELYLKVHFDNHDGSGLRPLSPDQRITATPYALAAEWAKMSTLSQGVSPGSITRTMLSAEVLADLNNTGSGSESNATFSPTPGSIVRSMLASDVLSDLNRTITKSMLGSDVLVDLNKTITRDMLPASVLTDLNRTISKSMLGGDVLADLNSTLAPGSVSRDKLSADILADLNKTITRNMLPASVLTDLNRTISKSMLGSDVLADLNQSIKTITRDMLPGSVLSDLNRTVTKSMLGSDVLADLNRTITKSMLGSDVLADLNRTVTPQMIQSSSITTAQLNEQILKYLKPEITVSPQAPGLIFSGQSMNLTSQAQGKYLTFQWQRNGQPIAGATQASFNIADVNGSLHDGNYSVVVSNDFGSVTSALTPLQVDGTPSAHTVTSISMEMIFCPPGTFTMGSPTSESGRGTDETQHQVTLTNGFYLGKYEVTQAQYQTVMNGNSEGLNADPSQFKGSNRPVEKASWEDAQIFLTRLNSIEQSAGRLPNGWKYVLPTEAEWEYACRAGTTTGYSWGNDINSSRANYNWDGGGNDGNDSKQTVEIGQFSANPWGFYDMHGNVWEWVQDWKANYLTGAQTDPEGPASGSSRVRRGGSWYDVGTYLRSAKRGYGAPSSRYSTIGFRVGFQAVKPDGANPELELFGGAGITREAGQAWAEPGAAGHDARDGNLTDSITISGTVDMNTTGTYILTYSVADAAGNEANASRTVTVVDTTNPVLTLLGDANMSQAKDSAWVDPGATASDSLDGNLTSSITITGTVDVNTTGVYTLTYSVSDGASNEANATRTVNVGQASTHNADLNASVQLQMLWVEPGTFTMGSPTTETGRGTNETEHNVTLTKGFYLGKYEVTQAQYEAVMTGNTDSLSATPSQWPNNPNRPVEKVSWADAQIFLTRLNAQQSANIPAGWAYVLPTESQWEYACRAGTTTMYSWGNDINATRANYLASGLSQTRDVGYYAANPWGFFDMHGNVWEWTADWFQAAYPTGNPVVNPTGPASGSFRVKRGGSWSNDGTSLRSAERFDDTPSDRSRNIGFRVCFQQQ